MPIVGFNFDSLNVEKAIKIKKYCGDAMKVVFGIGTHFSNDYNKASDPTQKSPALNMVIKLFEINRIPCVKLSDTPGKASGDTDAIRVAKWTFLGEPL